MPSPEAWLREQIETGGNCNAYPLRASESAAPPFAVFGRSATARQQQLAGVDDAPAGTFDLNLYADGYLLAKDLADAVRVQLTNFQPPDAGGIILSVHLDNERDGEPVQMEGRDTPTYVIEQTYTIRWEE